MSGLAYDSLHDDLIALGESQERYADSVQRMVEAVEARFAEEERLVAEIRDELHEAITALSNRIEALTNAR